MESSPKSFKYIILLLLLVGPGLILIYLSKSDHVFKSLPYYGRKEVVNIPGQAVPDTVYYQVPDFNFTNQDGEETSFEDFKGKIVVVDFFFTSCPTICPLMTREMERLQMQLDDPAYKNVRFLSHTVDPRHDTPEVLKEFAKKNNADPNRWTFVTGDQQKIFDQGFKGYMISAQEDSTAAGGFLHSSYFILIDPDRHVRGYYDGTSSKEVDDLVGDIKMLLKEEKADAKQKS